MHAVAEQLLSTHRRTVVLVLLGTAVASVVLAWWGYVPPAPRRINVRWVEEFPEPRRHDLEQRFHLAHGYRTEGTTWSYEILDTGPENLRAILSDADVDDTHGIDGPRLTLVEPPPPGPKAALAIRTLELLPRMVLGLVFVLVCWRLASGTRTRPALMLATAALVFAASVIFHWLNLSFTNDHFIHLSEAQALYLGHIPFRDFNFTWTPLEVALSALALLTFGYGLLGEAVLVIALLSVGYAIAFWLGARISGSMLVSLITTCMAIGLRPRLYSYPKVFVLAAVLLALWVYANRQDRVTLLMLSLCTAVAFLFRIDLGLYVAPGIVTMLALAHWREGHRALIARQLRYGVTVFLLLAPFTLLMPGYRWSASFVDTLVSAARWERGRTTEPWPSLDYPGGLLLVEPPPPPPPPRIDVRWVADLPDATRDSLEERFRLSRPERVEGDAWRYDLGLEQQPSVQSLIDSPWVAAVSGLDRSDTRPSEPGRSRTRLNPAFYDQLNAATWLLYVFVGLPVVAVLLVLKDYVLLPPERHRPAAETVTLVACCVVALAANALLLRGDLEYRLPDATVPAAIIGAWIVATRIEHAFAALRSPRGAANGVTPPVVGRAVLWGRKALAVGSAVVVATALAATASQANALAEIRRYFDNLRLKDGVGVTIALARERLALLGTKPPIDLLGARGAGRLLPTRINSDYPDVARYVRACTTRDDRLMVTLFAPELFFLSERTYAGGHASYMTGHWFNSHDEQRLLLDRMQDQSVPIVVYRPAETDEFRERFDLVYAHLEEHYQTVLESDFGGRVFLGIKVDRRMVPVSTDPIHGLPCFR